MEMVCEHINLMEKDYFSCSYIGDDDMKVTYLCATIHQTSSFA